ncbi:FtsW/RodA/SpoVE family cell cycle protein [Oenococcus alcoholitolerans]|uniref:FtsW/RodA/SpoVE family cell cycle protein n=1 Tax=Oenococcus alcoholitolerans TaxID=931074 RepID=UPI003F6EC09A
MNKIVRQIDWFIFSPFLILSFIGVLMVFSASSNFPSGAFNFLFHQFIFVIIGILTSLVICFFIKLSWLSSIKTNSVFMFLTLFLLFFARFLAPPTPGTGAHGWINFSFFNVQPAELFKLVLVLYLSALASEKMSKADFKDKIISKQQGRILLEKSNDEKKIFGFRRSQLAFIFINLFFVLIMPDLGNALICLFLIFVIIFSSGIKPIAAFLIILASVSAYISLPLILNILPQGFLKHNYQALRLLVFLRPWDYTRGASLQLVHSFYAVAHGGLFGVGLGNSIEKMGYLPEANTDFIMAILVEELGTISLAIIIGILLILIGRIFYLAFQVNDNYQRLVLYGIGSYFFVQALVNLGGIIGSLPMTGVTFPFISYGGSSALISSTAIGIVLLISRNFHKHAKAKPKSKNTDRSTK